MVVHGQRRHGLVAAMAGAAIALAVAPAARAAWTSPFDVGARGSPQYLGPVGVGGDVIVFSWSACVRLVFRSCSGDTRVLTRTRSIAAGRLGPVLSVSARGANAGDVHLAVAPNGDALFVWGESVAGLRARWMTGGVLGPIVDVESSPRHIFVAAIGSRGDAVIAWMVGDIGVGKHVRARTLSATASSARCSTSRRRVWERGCPASASARAAMSSSLGMTRAVVAPRTMRPAVRVTAGGC